MHAVLRHRRATAEGRRAGLQEYFAKKEYAEFNERLERQKSTYNGRSVIPSSPHHLISPHLTSPHFTSSHLISSYPISPHLISPHLISCHLTYNGSKAAGKAVGSYAEAAESDDEDDAQQALVDALAGEGPAAAAGTSEEEEEEDDDDDAIAEALQGGRRLGLNDGELGLLEHLARRLGGGGGQRARQLEQSALGQYKHR